MLAAGKPHRQIIEAVLDLIPERRALERFFNGGVQRAAIVHALDTQAIGHVFIHRLRERIGLLKDHADPAAEIGDIDGPGENITPVNPD